MDIDFIGGKKVTLILLHHINEALEAFGKTLKGNIVKPATSKLFTITDETQEIEN